jgi:hypothetical protein
MIEILCTTALILISVGLFALVAAMRSKTNTMRGKHLAVARVESHQSINLQRTRVSALLCLFTILCVFWFEWPFKAKANGIVQYKDPAAICVESGGRVKQVYVQNGQPVRTGDVLMVLENRTLQSQLRLLKLEMQRSVLTGQKCLQNNDVPGFQLEQAKRKETQHQIVETEKKIDSLIVRASCDGTVKGDDLQQLTGRHLTAGTQVMSIVNPSQKQIVLSIPKSHVDSLDPGQAVALVFSMPCYHDSLKCTLETGQPTISYRPTPMMTSAAGNSMCSDSKSATQMTASFVDMPVAQIPCGATGQITLPRQQQSIGSKMMAIARQWLQTFDQEEVEFN